MGNNSTKQPQQYEIVSSYNNRHWFLKDHLKHCDVWENKLLNIPAQAYKIPENKSNQELELYAFRNINSKDIVGIYHVIYEEKQFLCSTTTTMIVLTQRIPVRLNGLQQLSEEQALTVLRTVYSGLNAVGAHFGPVKINQQCIGFTQDGRCKVWINPNFSLNQPMLLEDSTIQNTQRLNHIRVMQIFEIVNNKTDRRCLDQLKRIFIEKQPTYFQAINLIDIYCQRRNLIITERINQIVINKLFLVNQQTEFNQTLKYSTIPAINQKPLPIQSNSIYSFQQNGKSFLQKNIKTSEQKNINIANSWRSPAHNMSSYSPSQYFKGKPLYTPQNNNRPTNISFNYKPVVAASSVQHNFNRAPITTNIVQSQNELHKTFQISSNPQQCMINIKETKENMVSNQNENNLSSRLQNKQIIQEISQVKPNLTQYVPNQHIKQIQQATDKLNSQILKNKQEKVEQKKEIIVNHIEKTKQQFQSKPIIIEKLQSGAKITEEIKIESNKQQDNKNIEKIQQKIIEKQGPIDEQRKDQTIYFKNVNTQPQIIKNQHKPIQNYTAIRQTRQTYLAKQNIVPEMLKKQQQIKQNEYKSRQQQQPKQQITKRYSRRRIQQHSQQPTNYRQQPETAIINEQKQTRKSRRNYKDNSPNQRQRYQIQQKNQDRPYSRQYRSRPNRYSRQRQGKDKPTNQSHQQQVVEKRAYRTYKQPFEQNSKYSRSYQQSQVREISEQDLNNAPRFGRSRQRQDGSENGRVRYSRADSVRQIKRLDEERRKLLRQREQIAGGKQMQNSYENDESPAPKFGGNYQSQILRQRQILGLQRSATQELFQNINTEEKNQNLQIENHQQIQNKDLQIEQIPKKVQNQKQFIQEEQNKPSECENIQKHISTGAIEEQQQRPQNLRDYEQYIRRKHNVPKYDKNTKTFSISSSQKLSKQSSQKLSKVGSRENISYDPTSQSIHYRGIGNYEKDQNGIQIGSSQPKEQQQSGYHNTMTFMPKDRAAKKKEQKQVKNNVRVEQSRVDKLIDSEKNDTIIDSVQSSKQNRVYNNQTFRRTENGLGQEHTRVHQQYGPNGYKSSTTTTYKYSSRENIPELKSIESKYQKEIPFGQGEVARSRHQKYIQTKTTMSKYDPQPINSYSGIKKKQMINMDQLRNIL